MAKQQWNDMTTAQKSFTVLGIVAQFGLLGAALYDLSKRTPDQINGSKRLWTVFVFVNFIGPITYFARGRKSDA